MVRDVAAFRVVALSDLVAHQFDGHTFAGRRGREGGIGEAEQRGWIERVDPSGARRWVQRLVIRGRSRMLGLGGYPLVSLAETRDVAFAHRKQARAGGDPLTESRLTRQHGPRGDLGIDGVGLAH